MVNTKLSFAEMLLKKVLATTTESADLCRIGSVLVDVLVMKQDHAAALKMLEAEVAKGKEQSGYVIADVRVWIAEIQQDLKAWREAAEAYGCCLKQDGVDNWRNWTGYLESLFASILPKDQGGVQADVAWNDISAVRQEATKFAIELEAESPKLRGPRLAKVSLEYRALLLLLAAKEPAKEHVDVVVAALVEQICSYVEAFDSRQCCFSDLRNFLLVFCKRAPEAGEKPGNSPPFPPQHRYLHMRHLGVPLHHEATTGNQSRRWPVDFFAGLLDAEAVEPLKRFLEERAKAKSRHLSGSKAASDKEAIAQLWSFANCHQMLRFLGAQDVGESLERVALYLSEYTLSLEVNGDQAILPGDDLLLLAAHNLLDLADVSEDESSRVATLVQAAALLEHGLKKSPGNFLLRLALIEVYGSATAFSPLLEHYENLQISYIQLDSMSHYVLGRALHAGFYGEARMRAQKLIDFWWTSYRNNSRWIKDAYEKNNFQKALEFFKLDRMQTESHQLKVATSLSYNLSLLLQHGINFNKLMQFTKAEMVSYDTFGSFNDEDFEWNTSPLSMNLDVNFDKCVLNYDFTAEASWDCPLSSQSAKLVNMMENSSKHFCSGMPRHCRDSGEYLYKWKNALAVWMKLHNYMAQMLLSVDMTKSANIEKLIPVIRSSLLQLKFLHLKDDTEEDNPIWRAFFRCCEISQALVSLQSNLSDKERKNEISLVNVHMEKVSEYLQKAREEYESAAAQTDRPVLNAELIEKHANDLAYVWFWIVLLVRSWAGIVPKSRRKKKKLSSDVKYELDSEPLIPINYKSVVTKLSAALTACSALVTACKLSEEQISKVQTVLLEDSPVAGLVGNELLKHTAALVAESHNQSYINLAAICIQHKALLKETKLV